MIERIHPLARPVGRRRESLGGSSLLALPAGDVVAFLRPLAIDLARRRCSYELRVDNATPFPVAAFAYPAGTDRAAFDWHTVAIPPRSSVAVAFDLPYESRLPAAAVAQIVAADAALTLEAAAAGGAGRLTLPRGIAGVAAVALLALAGTLWAAARPAVVALAVPATVTAHERFTVAYAATNANAVRYDVVAPDGELVRRGTLAEASGTFALDLPVTPRGAGYDLVLEARNDRGTDRRTAHVFAAAAPAVPVRTSVHVAAFRLATGTVMGGEPIAVTYETNAPAGIVELLDQAGTARATAALAADGRATLIAPHVDRDQDFRVVLHAAGWGTTQDATIAVHVRHDAHRAPTPSPEQLAAQAAARASAGGVHGPIALDGTEVFAGRPFTIDILHPEPHLRLTIDDRDGVELRASVPAPGVDRVLLVAPAVAGSYSLVVTYDHGVGAESLIVPLDVHAGAASALAPGPSFRSAWSAA